MLKSRTHSTCSWATTCPPPICLQFGTLTPTITSTLVNLSRCYGFGCLVLGASWRGSTPVILRHNCRRQLSTQAVVFLSQSASVALELDRLGIVDKGKLDLGAQRNGSQCQTWRRKGLTNGSVSTVYPMSLVAGLSEVQSVGIFHRFGATLPEEPAAQGWPLGW